MVNTSSAAPDPLRAWRDATGGSGQPTNGGETVARDDRPQATAHRLPRLVVLAAAACIGALCLAALAATRVGTPEPAGAQVTPRGEAKTPAATPATATAVTLPAEPAVAGDVAAAAVLAVRSSAPRTRYVDTAVAEVVQHVGDVSIVTVRALVLHATGDGWDGGRQARYAVAVARHGGTPVALATPWALATPADAERQISWRPVDDSVVRDLAAEALTAQGYRMEGPMRLHSSAALPGVLQARMRAVAPAEDRTLLHEVWVRADDGDVLGATSAPPQHVPGAHP